MQHFDTLWKVINAAGQVRDLAHEARTYQFQVEPPLTVYLHAEHAHVDVVRWSNPIVEAHAALQAGFGWRVQTDQDDAGVYIVAKRRAVVGNLSRATFELYVPHETYLILKLENGALTQRDLDGTYHLPPTDADADKTVIMPQSSPPASPDNTD